MKDQAQSTGSINDYKALVKQIQGRPVSIAAVADNTRGINQVQFVFVALWENATLVAPLFAVAPQDTIYPGQSKSVPLAPNEWEVTSYQYFWHEAYGGDWHVIQGPRWTAPAGYFYTNAGIVWTPPHTLAADGSLPLTSIPHPVAGLAKKTR